jgi:hypothetical protein
LASLRGDPPRIVLMDQNEDGRLCSVVDTWSRSLRLEHVIIPPRGVSQARNAGIACLREETLVAFPDDDCCYEPTTLQDAEEAFASDQRVDTLISHWYGIGEPPPSRSKGNALRQVGPILALRQSPTYTLFFRRSAIIRAGSFDETLGPGGGTPWLCGEDADFLLRAGAQAGTAAFAPRVRVSHPRIDVGAVSEKAYGYGRGRMRVLHKHHLPLWFQVASILHPLMCCVTPSAGVRRFRWHLFRGRLREWMQPHRLGTV